MCLGAIGDALKGADKFINNTLDPLLSSTQKVTGEIFGEGNIPSKVFDKITNHPLESAAAAVTAWSSLGAGGALGGEGAAAGGAAAEGTGTAAGASLPADASVGTTGAGGATASAGGTAEAGSAASSSWLDYAKTAGKVLAPTVLSSLLQKSPKTRAQTTMPDQQAETQAARRKLVTQLAQRGRASTILTSPSGGGSLGG